MIISVPKKVAKAIIVPTPTNPQVVAAIANNLSLAQLKTVDISQAEIGDVLTFSGTQWQAESLDGGEFN